MYVVPATGVTVGEGDPVGVGDALGVADGVMVPPGVDANALAEGPVDVVSVGVEQAARRTTRASRIETRAG